MLEDDEVVVLEEEGGEEGGEGGGEGRRRRRSSTLSNSGAGSSSSSSSTCSLSSSSKEARYRGLVLQLRPASRELLGHLLRHLRRVVARSEENKMTAENLAVTVGLNLLRKSESVAGRCVGGRKGGKEGGGHSACGSFLNSSHTSPLFPFLASLTGVSIQQLEKERLVIMDLIALSPALFPLDGAGSINKAHPPPKPYHAPRLINSAPASRTPRHFFSLTDEMARRTAPLPATGGGEDDRDIVAPPAFLKPPPKPLGRPHQGTTNSSSSSSSSSINTIASNTTSCSSGSSRPKSTSRSSSGSNSSIGGKSGSSALPRVAKARTNPLATTLPLRPPDKPMRASPRRASSHESVATSSPALSVSSCSLSTEGKEDDGGGAGREGAASNGQGNRAS